MSIAALWRGQFVPGQPVYFGSVVGGIALGTTVTASVAGMAPVAPAANMLVPSRFYKVQGYWDYCSPALLRDSIQR
jgi:hypothetical protein